MPRDLDPYPTTWTATEPYEIVFARPATASTSSYLWFSSTATTDLATWTWGGRRPRWRRLRFDETTRAALWCEVVDRYADDLEDAMIDLDPVGRGPAIHVPDARAAFVAARLAAHEKARALLLRLLAPDQRADFEQHQRFTVEGQDGRLYVLHLGRAANVHQLDADMHVERVLCLHPAEPVPDCDTLLVQKLMIESDLDRFLATANVHPARRRA